MPMANWVAWLVSLGKTVAGSPTTLSQTFVFFWFVSVIGNPCVTARDAVPVFPTHLILGGKRRWV